MGFSSQTKEFGLPQYVLSDVPQMEDFNKAFKTISENLGKGGNVDSVNGKTGVVVLSAKDVGAANKIINTASGAIIAVNDASAQTLEGLTLYGKTTHDGTPTPEAPVELESVGDGGSVEVMVCGKNLFALAESGSVNAEGIESTNSNDTNRRTPYIKVAEGEKFAFSKAVAFTVTTHNGMIRLYDENKNFIGSAAGILATMLSNVYTVGAGVAYIRFVQFGYGLYSGVNLQMEKGDTVTDYDGTVAQTLTAQTPNGLAGIPVDSGGNYTDSDGQQWICDEVDFARGLKIQRIGRIESYNGESVGDVFMSSTGELSTGATVIYPLAEPIETPLTADELAQYAALHTNKPNTTILNNGGAGMMANYTADTKIYIDKKFEALTAAIAAVENNEI